MVLLGERVSCQWRQCPPRPPSLSTISLLALLMTVLSPVPSSSLSLKRICYLRPDFYLPVSVVVQMDLCTHIIIGFTSIDGTGSIAKDDHFIRFAQLCRQTIDTSGHGKTTSAIKLMFSVGGGGVGGFELASSTAQNRKRFAASILEFTTSNGFDGVDIDWEFPSWGYLGNFSRRFERDNFSLLLKEIRQEFIRHQSDTGKQLILSAAVAAQITMINVCYRPKEIGLQVDFINLMTYDYYTYKFYWPFTGFNSALHARPVDFGIASTFNIEWSANYWHMIGLAKEQIMVGIPTYGKRFTLYSKYLNYPGSLAVSSKGDNSYSEVCDFLNLNNTVQKVDQHAKVAYAFNGYDWISYEDESSVSVKAHWIRQNHFGGAMLFSLNADDFRFRCRSDTRFPLHQTVRDALLAS